MEINNDEMRSQALSYLREGNYDLAIRTYQKFDYTNHHTISDSWNLGICLLLNGNEEEAQMTWFESIAEVPSDQLESLTNQFANTLAEEAVRQQNEGKLQNAWLLRQYIRESLPNDIDNLLLLADVCSDLGLHGEAQEHLFSILELQSNHAESLFKLGNIALNNSDLVSAEHFFQKSIQSNPNYATPYINLGAVHARRGDYDLVEPLLDAALNIDPNIPELYANFGSVFVALGRFQDSINSYQKAISLREDYFEAYVGLITALSQQSNYKLLREVTEQLEQKFGHIDPVYTQCELVHAFQASGIPGKALDKIKRLEELIFSLPSLTVGAIDAAYHHLFFSFPHLRDDPQRNTNLMRYISKLYLEGLEKTSPSQVKLADKMVKRSGEIPKLLRLGFISPNFRRHSVSWCSGDIIFELANITPHIFLYCTRKSLVDDRTQLFERIAEKMYFPTKLSANGAVDPDPFISQIYNDDIDVLIDLDSITGAPTSVQIIKAKPAPVCITWMGFDAPFVSESNYYLADIHTRPLGIEKLYLEQFVRMPDSILAISGFDIQALDRESIRRGYDLEADQVAYLSVAPSSKLNPETVMAHVEILKQVPKSVLLCKTLGDIDVIQTTYQEICKNLEVDMERIKYVGVQVPEEKHRMIYLAADVLLDSYPMNGGTYTLEALWFNLPLVTKVGEQFCSRMGYSFMQVLGIETGIAWNWEEYIRWGVELGQNSDLRFEVQEQLRKSKQPDSLSPLWNPKKFAEDMYRILEQLFLQSQSNQEIYEQSKI